MSTVFKLFTLSAAALSLMALTGAAEARTRGCDRGDQALGAIAGAVIGGVIGGQFGNGGDDRALGAVAGVLLGGAAGASIADNGCNNARYDNSYDNQGYYDAQAYDDGAYDNRGYYADDNYGAQDGYYAQNTYYDDAFDNAAPYESVAWQDPDTGYRGTLEPQDWYQDDRGNDCREFSQEIYIDGRRQEATGTACRQSDGTWRIVE
ncbi:hypothetical protein sos41_14680 [Alphaproteobacteria bacterium SO-S41]|nr:hypothetical protein sos41_14680 [Alphaproteobacteria bacterium SO-S41]